MPHVAFEPSIVLKPILTARSNTDRSAAPPFESLLDNTQAADSRPADNQPDTDVSRADRDQPAPRDTSNKASSSDRPDSKPATSKASDAKSADNKSDDAARADAKADGKATTDAKATDGTKASADAKSEAKSETKAKTAGKTAEQLAADAKTTDGAKPADVGTGIQVPVTVSNGLAAQLGNLLNGLTDPVTGRFSA